MNGVDETIIRPKAIDSAFQAVLVSVAVSALGTVFTVLLDRAFLTRLVTQTLESVPPEQRLSTGSMVGAMQVALAFGIAVFVGLFLLFAVKMRAGRNWARILITIYTLVGVWSFLTSIATAGAELKLMWSLADVLFSVTAVVYMFRPESTKYFAQHKERRLRARQRP
jgi:hypothetical protein